MSDVTRILNVIEHREATAAEELLSLVYDELRKLAAAKMAHEVPDQTLQPTALVHEAWLRLMGNGTPSWDGRAHFFGAAAEAMRRILIDNARRKNARKHGAGLERVELESVEVPAQTDETMLLFVDESLELLAQEDPQSAELVKLRFFAGFTNEEAAETLGISERTAKRYWTFARAWFYERHRRDLAR